MSGVGLNEDDALYLDGARLIAVGDCTTGGTRCIEYRKESDDLTRVRETGADFASATFVVQTKGGTTLVFDGSNGSRAKFSDGKVLLAAVSRIVDTVGNFMEFRYVAGNDGDFNIDAIRYTGRGAKAASGDIGQVLEPPYAEIKFGYEAARPWSSYVVGHLLQRAVRLTSIVSRIWHDRDDFSNSAGAVQVAKYTFEYEDRDDASRFVLTRLHAFGSSADELQPTTFSYSKIPAAFKTPNYSLPPALPSFAGGEALGYLASGYRLAHISSTGGAPDLLFSAVYDGKLVSLGYRNTHGQWRPLKELSSPVAFVSGDGNSRGVILADLNGDGREDIVESDRTSGSAPLESSAYTSGSGGWTEAPGYKLSFPLATGGVRTRYLLARFSGGVGPDLVYDDGGSLKFLRNTGSGWAGDPAYNLPVKLGPESRAVDVDCDGTPELVVAEGTPGSRIWSVYKFGAQKWEKMTAAFEPPFPAETDPEAVRALDLNGDGFADLIVATAVGGGSHQASIATAAGWKDAPAKAPAFDLVDAAGNASGAVILNLDDDGAPDIAANRTLPNGQKIVFAQLQTAAGWSPWSAVATLPQLASQTAGDVSFNLLMGSLNNDRFTDLILPGASRTALGQIYLGSAQGLAPAPADSDFVPPIVLARQDKQDRGIRLVDLNGDGLPDLIFDRDTVKNGTVTASDTGAYINTGSGWKAAPGLDPGKIVDPATGAAIRIPFFSDDVAGSPVQFVDVDGDGYLDLVYFLHRSDGTQVRYFVHNVSDGNGNRVWHVEPASSAFLPPVALADQKNGDLGVRFVDLDGDGRPDMLVGVLSSSGRSASAYRNTGSGWERAPQFDPPVDFVAKSDHADFPTRDLAVQIVDVDGDRLPDLVAWYKSPFGTGPDVKGVWTHVKGACNAPASCWTKSSIDVPTELDAPLTDPKVNIQWLDVNGDGLVDLVLTNATGGKSSNTWLSTGAGFVDSAAWKVPLEAISDRSGDPAFRFVDANGDGYSDIVYAREGASGTPERSYFFNTVAGWHAGDPAVVAQIPPFVDKDGTDRGVRLIDVDGNGLSDVIQSFASNNGGAPDKTAVLVNPARRAAVLESIDTGEGLKTNLVYQTMLETAPDAGGLSLGAVSTTAPWQRVYERPGGDWAYPRLSPMPTSYVVRRAVVEDGNGSAIGFSYRYGGYVLQADAMLPLGFGWRESYNEESHILTRAELVQDARFGVKPSRDAECLVRFDQRPAGALPVNLCPAGPAPSSGWIRKLSENKSDWQVDEGVVGPAHLKLYQTALKRSEAFKFELDGGTVSARSDVFTYDAADVLHRRLDVLDIVSTNGDGTATHTVNEYSDDDARWLLGRLTKSTVTKTGDAHPAAWHIASSETRVSAFTYDRQTGLLETSVSNIRAPGDAGPDMSVHTSVTRDDFGNVKTSTVTANGETPRLSASTFDDSAGKSNFGRFATSQVNPLLQKIATEYDMVFGVPTLVTDQNGLKTEKKYDSIGRLVRTIEASGATVDASYLPVADLPDQCVLEGIRADYAIRQTTSYPAGAGTKVLPATIQIFDNRQHLLRTVTEGFTKDASQKRSIRSDQVFDKLGRLVKSSLPYERSSCAGAPSPVYWSTARYDDLNRVVETVAPDNARTTTQFASRPGFGMKVTSTDALTHVSVAETNGRGLIVKQSAGSGGANTRVAVTYFYDAGDRLARYVTQSGATTTFQYDAFGNRVGSSDPDLGRWKYEFNAFGQLKSQLDPKGQTTTLNYDLIGRRVALTEAGVASKWIFDTAANGVGNIAEVDGSDGYREVTRYDAFGRRNMWSVTAQGQTFTTQQENDRLGRIASVTYSPPPDSHAAAPQVGYFYDDKGFLREVKDQSGASLWHIDAMDEANRVRAEAFGNGEITRTEYDPKTGRPQSIKVVDGQSKPVEMLKLVFDLVGNLRSRSDPAAGVDQTFSYDVLDRLTDVRSKKTLTAHYGYDASGRITFKTGVGSYFYGGAGGCPGGSAAPFDALSSIAGGGQPGRYCYDADGNMTKAPRLDLSFDAGNRLVKAVERPSHTTTRFKYSPDGQRYYQLSDPNGQGATETIYAGGMERITKFGPGQPTDDNRQWVRYRYYVSNGSGTFAAIEVPTAFSPVPVPPGGVQAKLPLGRKIWYFSRDQLGSVVAVYDEQGKPAGKFQYDPWGARTTDRYFDVGGHESQQIEQPFGRGFTGHEALTGLGLIHMNGRVYDPRLGIFVSPDPVGTDPYDLKTVNRYAYAADNPLRYVDPTGYGLFGGIGHFFGGVVHAIGGAIGSIGSAVGNALNDAGKWVGENWRTIVIVAVAVAVTVVTGGLGAPLLETAILSGMAAGAASGATAAILYGGSFDDVMEAAIKGGVVGGISAGAFYGVGSAFSGQAGSLGSPQSFGAIAGHGVVGGAMESAQGGDFWRGFEAAALTKATSAYGPDFHSYSANVARAAVVGGATSEITGGKFANGAVTGAFSYMFNDAMHREMRAAQGAALGSAVGAVAGPATCVAVTEGACALGLPAVSEAGALTGSGIGAVAGYLYGTAEDILSGDVFASQKNPFDGEPGSSSTTWLPDGTPKQTRTYGSDGYPQQDIDYDHDHGEGRPHVHDWTRPADGSKPTKENRMPGRPLGGN